MKLTTRDFARKPYKYVTTMTEPIVLTSTGKPKYVILPYEQWESLRRLNGVVEPQPEDPPVPANPQPVEDNPVAQIVAEAYKKEPEEASNPSFWDRVKHLATKKVI